MGALSIAKSSLFLQRENYEYDSIAWLRRLISISLYAHVNLYRYGVNRIKHPNITLLSGYRLATAFENVFDHLAILFSLKDDQQQEVYNLWNMYNLWNLYTL